MAVGCPQYLLNKTKTFKDLLKRPFHELDIIGDLFLYILPAQFRVKL
jgi:hypothetical protein